MTIKMLLKTYAVAALMALATLPARSQAPEVVWDVDFRTLFDNREGDDRYTQMQTFFQTQLAPEVGLAVMNGTHRVSGGVTWIQPMGSTWDGYKLLPTVYYNYRSERVKLWMGQFSRDNLHEKLPEFLWSDSISYREPNIRGVLIQLNHEQSFADLFIDWRGRQSETVREEFNIKGNGAWRKPGGVMTVGFSGMMNHLAKRKNAPDDEYIVDNVVLNLWAGVNLSGRAGALDSLTIKAGPLLSTTRYRIVDRWRKAGGVWIDVAMRWRWIEAKNTFYWGNNLFPYKAEYFQQLYMMSPYYQAHLYNRTEGAIVFVRNRYIELRGGLVFNITPDNFNFYQQLSLHIAIGS